MTGEQGRKVMAVRGSPLDPRASCTNGLIRQGALLMRNARDGIEAPASLPAMAELFETGPERPGLPVDVPAG